MLAFKRKRVEATEEGDLPVTEKGKKADKELLKIKEFLETLEQPQDLDREALKCFLKKASNYLFHTWEETMPPNHAFWA